MDRAGSGVGAEQPILLGGLDDSNYFSHWLQFAPDDDHLVPVLTSELGADDPTGGYVGDYLAWSDDHGIGSLFWADHPSDPVALVRNESGSTTAYGALARRYLRGPRSPEIVACRLKRLVTPLWIHCGHTEERAGLA